MKYQPHEYQLFAQWKIEEQDAVGLLLEMGLGKTIITLSAVENLMYNAYEVQKVLVIAPLRVAQTVWDAEAAKWDHTKHLRFSKVLGNPREREAALERDADVYLINRENVPWLCGRYAGKAVWPFDMVVIDELSSFKSRSAERFKALRKVRPKIHRIVGLTGTPAPNGLLDLWPQMYLLDQGHALYRTMTQYRDEFFTPGKRNGQIVYEWRLKDHAEEAIYNRLSDLCVSMKAQDWLRMPERIDNVIRVEIPADAKAQYDSMERDLILPLKGQTITATSAAVVVNKLLQMAGGAVYDDDGKSHELHRAKLDAMRDIVEAANGNPTLCYYAYKHERDRLLAEFPQARELKSPQDVRDWNDGRIPLMLCHPDSAGHGLNLQAGGHVLVWFGLTWSLEKYQQANARLHRQGQKEAVIVHHIIAKDTMDERVLAVLEAKDRRQDALMEAVKARMEEITYG